MAVGAGGARADDGDGEAVARLQFALDPQGERRIGEGGVAQTLRRRPGLALLSGFIALVCIPVAALIFFITLIGAPLGLLALLLYFVLLLLGYVATSVALGDWALQRFKADAAAKTAWRIGAAMLAVLAFALLGSVPYLGGLVVFAALLAGIGAIMLQMAPRAGAAA